MAVEKKKGLGQLLMNLTVFLFTVGGLCHTFFNQFSFETRLAGKSVLKIIALLFLIGTVFFSIWFCVLAMLFLYLSGLHYGPYLALLMIIVLNLLIMVYSIIVINHIRKHCFYREIRKELQQIKKSFD